MPSKPQPLANRVRVRHTTTGAEKDVQRSQLDQLSSRWERVPVTERKSKRPPTKAVDTPAEPEEPASKEEE